MLEGNRAVGVQFLHQGTIRRITARRETVRSLGAINTPKVLMQSGIGDARQLTRAGIKVAQHLPGVGRNFQDHILVPCVCGHIAAASGQRRGSNLLLEERSVARHTRFAGARGGVSVHHAGARSFLTASGVMVTTGMPRTPWQPREIADHRSRAVRPHRNCGRDPFRSRRHKGADPCGRALPRDR
jgi:choline dehydrogenase-like flavoprotein